MRSTYLLGCLALVAAVAARAQDTRPAKTLKVPTSAPVVAEAAMRGDADAVRKLVAQGADVNAPQGDGMTALHWAAEHGDVALTETLLRAHASVKAVTRIGNYTPLHVASKTGNAAVMKALLKAGADANAATSSGATSLHMAASA